MTFIGLVGMIDPLRAGVREAVADALLIGMRQGKLNQGLGVYEAIDLTFQKGLLDIEAELDFPGREAAGMERRTGANRTAGPVFLMPADG